MILLTTLFDREDEEELLSLSKKGLPNAPNTFQWALIDGIVENVKTPISVFNILPVGVFPKRFKKVVLKDRSWDYKNCHFEDLGAPNIHFLKQFTRYRKLKKKLKSVHDETVLMYSTYEPYLHAIQSLDSSVHVSIIVTDLPQFGDFHDKGSLWNLLRNMNNKRIYKYLDRVDSFVLITEAMKEPLNVGERPYVIVEGIANPTNIVDPKPAQKKVIMYAGGLHVKFGLDKLCEAFSLIESDDYELWLCGKGDYVEEIKSLASTDKRIRFFGYVGKQQILEMQSEASILINPRCDEEEFTKYSFPSKTMEYMLSGVPVLMYKLSGVPHEYDQYLNYFEGDSPESMAESIVSLCEDSRDEAVLKAGRAKEFVLNHKNSASQAKRIMSMLKEASGN